MADIVNLFLRKGFLVEPKLTHILRNISYLIAEDFVDIVSSKTSGKMLSEKSFIINIGKIIDNLSNLSIEKHEKKTEFENAIKLLNSFFKKEEKKLPEQERKTEEIKKEIEENKEISISELKKEIKQETPEADEKERQQIIPLGQNFAIKNYLIPEKKFCVDNFTEHYKNRFLFLRDLMQKRHYLENLTSISKLSSHEKQRISIIGMIFSKNKTKNKNIILKMEDLTGQVSVLVKQDKEEIYKIAENLVEDDVIAISGTGNAEFVYVNEILLPDINAKKRSLENEGYAVFISDTHVGSGNFLEKEFSNFIKWINTESGTEQQKEIAKKVKYLFIVGDTVDGVGVFPGQERLLAIKDLKDQYAKLGEFLDSIRKDIEIFMSPGQHDATRLAEPQPPISKFYAESLYNIKNLHLVTNPAVITIGISGTCPGLRVLMYHGASFHNLINEVDELRTAKAHDTPTKVAKVLLRKRHLAPSHSFTTYLPAPEDALLINEVPDILATGDLHRSEVSVYNNILLIASSCWQTITQFEEKVGNHPEPCKVPILNLKSGQVKIMDFT